MFKLSFKLSQVTFFLFFSNFTFRGSLELTQVHAEISWTYSKDGAEKENNLQSNSGEHTPGSSSAWTSQEVQRMGLSPLAATGLVPSLQIQGSEMAGAPSAVFLRGSPSTEVLILWNGIELNDPTAGSGGASPVQLQREFSHQLRITKGPSTLLQGSRALAGVIDWQRSPAITSRIVVGGGTLENQTGLLEIQHRKSKDSPAWGIGLSQNRQQGLSVSSAPPGNEKDTQNLETGSAFLEWQAAPNLKIDFLAIVSKLEQDDDLSGAQALAAKASSRHQGGRFGLEQVLSERDLIQFEYQNLQSGRENRNDPVTAPGGYLDKSWGERTKKTFTWTHQGNNSAMIDFKFHTDTVDETMTVLSEFETSPRTTFDRFQMTQGVAAVWSTRKKNSQVGFRVDQFNPTPERRESVSSWQLQQRWIEGWLSTNLGIQPFVTISEGHRFPTLYQRFSSFGTPDLQTQVLRAAEIGVEGASWKLTTFRNDYTKMIDYDFAVGKYQNRGKTQIQGVEAEISGESNSERWQVGLTYLSARDLVLEQRLSLRPTYSTSGVWTHQFSDLLSSTWTLRWMDARPDAISATQTNVLPPSWQSDLNFQFRQQSLLVWNFYLKNIFNSNSEEVTSYTVAPRSAFISVEHSF